MIHISDIKVLKINNTFYLSQKPRNVLVEKEPCPFFITGSVARPPSASG